MDNLDKYLLKEFFGYFVVVLLALASMHLGIDFLSHFWGMNMPVSNALWVYAYRIPVSLQLFVPVAALMAALLVVTQMSRQNEVLALYASGTSPVRILSTFVAAVAVLSTLSFLLFDPIVPILNKKRSLTMKGLDSSQENMLQFRGSGFWYRSGKLAYNVGHYSPETNSLQDVTIYLFDPHFYLQERIHAKEAIYADNQWTLKSGINIKYPIDTKYPQVSSFEERSGLIPEAPSDFKTLVLEDETMRLRDLRKYIARNRGYGLDTTKQQVHYHERVAMVFTPLIFVLFGVPFVLRALKNHSAARSVGFCFLIVFAYLVFMRTTVSMGKGGQLPPVVAAWLPNVVFLLFAGFRVLRQPS